MTVYYTVTPTAPAAQEWARQEIALRNRENRAHKTGADHDATQLARDMRRRDAHLSPYQVTQLLAAARAGIEGVDNG